MTDERSKEDILAGVLRIVVGGQEKLVPTLKLRAVREWQAKVAEKIGLIRPTLAPDPSADTFHNVMSMTLDGILDLVVAYDQTSALGGREWLEDHADPAQLYAAVVQMGQVTFPFVEDGTTLIATFPELFVVPKDEASASTSSTNGHSPTGDLTPESLKTVSTRTS